MTRSGRWSPYLVRFLVAQLVSALGDSALWLAAGIWVHELTGSSASAALTFLFFLLPALSAPISGALVDRVRRREALIVLNLATIVSVLPLVWVGTDQDVHLIYAVMFGLGIIASAKQPAQSAQLVELATQSALPTVNGVLRSSLEALRLVSPALGAGLFAAAGGPAVVGFTAFTSLVAALLIATLPGRQAPQAKGVESIGTALMAGLKFLLAVPDLRRLTLVCALFTSAAGVIEALRWAVVTDGLGVNAVWMGPLQMVMAMGSIVCGLWAARLIRRWSTLHTVALAMLGFAAGSALWTIRFPLTVVAGALLVGGAGSMLIVAALTLIQTRTPNHLQGRVFAGFDVLTTGPQIISLGVGSFLVATVDYRISLAVLAGICLALSVLTVRVRT